MILGSFSGDNLFRYLRPVPSNTAALTLYLHIYFNSDIQNESFKSLRFNVNSAKQDYNEAIYKLLEQRAKEPKKEQDQTASDS